MEDIKVLKLKSEIEIIEKMLKTELENKELNEVLVDLYKKEIVNLQWCLNNQNSEFEVWHEKIKKEYGIFEYMPNRYRTIRNLVKLYLYGNLDVDKNLTTEEKIRIKDVIKLADKEIMGQLELYINVFGEDCLQKKIKEKWNE